MLWYCAIVLWCDVMWSGMMWCCCVVLWCGVGLCYWCGAILFWCVAVLLWCCIVLCSGLVWCCSGACAVLCCVLLCCSVTLCCNVTLCCSVTLSCSVTLCWCYNTKLIIIDVDCKNAAKTLNVFFCMFRRYGNNEHSTWNVIKIVNVLIIFRLVRAIFNIKVGGNVV